MVRTTKAAVFCILCHLVGRYNAYESPLQVFAKPKDIKQLFKEVGKTYDVSAGTAKQGPYLHPIYDFHCGEVTVKTITPTMIIQRRFLYYAKESWHWLSENYTVNIRNSSGSKPRNYADLTTMHGMKTLVASMYLLWMDDTCALLFNNKTSDCESWDFRKPQRGGAAPTLCTTLTRVCQKPDFRYFNIPQCYIHYPH
uniref:Putative secreted protein n=1 Tax=Ixodes ricinus TaxID=34613 RepID=A0A090X9J4_IXORI